MAEIPCEVFVPSGRSTNYGHCSGPRENCATCGWTADAHTEETRAVARGEHPDSVPDGRGGFYRRPKWGSPHRA